MKRYLLAIFIFLHPLMLRADIASDIMSEGEVLKELRDVIADIGLNCASPNNWPMAVNELRSILTGTTRVLAEQLQTLAYKKDYPTACHVMTQDQINRYTAEEVQTGSKKIDNGVFTTKAKIYSPKPTYYWPKYFVEVSNKGNDPHKAFANGNLIYTVNRKIANALSSFLDLDGSSALAAKLFGTVTVVDNLSSQIGMNAKGFDKQRLLETSVLGPFEKMRIRASSSPTNTNYDVNIWPVGLSEALGSEFSVCGSEYQKKGEEIGYSWPFKGVAMTCPVAMSKDAYTFWDTGMIDYLDPQAVSSMKIAADPVACGASVGIAKLAFEGKSKAANPIGNISKVDGAIGKLSSKLSSALKPCSWPVLGPAEAIARAAVSMTDVRKWKGPYCTLWGSIAPRASNSVFNNDYSMANAALKFKLLSHELFGTPRGEAERWSLAYPWEGEGGSPFGEMFEGFDLGFLDNLQSFSSQAASPISKHVKDKGFGQSESANNSRSHALYPAGDPRLMDASKGDLLEGAKNFGKELAYLATILGLSDEAARRARSAYEDKFGESTQSPEEMRSDLNREISRAEDESAELGKESVYEYREFCHASDERHGNFVGTSNFSFRVNFDGYYGTPNPMPFAQNISQSRCFGTSTGGCLKRKLDGTCGNKRKGHFVHYKRLVKTGTRDVPNPRIFKITQSPCKVRVDEGTAAITAKAACEDKLVEVGKTDTRQYATRPNPEDGRTITQRDDTAQIISNVARSSAMASAEIARAKLSDISASNPLPGRKRVYTIWERIQCEYPATVTKWSNGMAKFSVYDSCESAVKFKVKEFVQLKLLRKICDLMGQKIGGPFK